MRLRQISLYLIIFFFDSFISSILSTPAHKRTDIELHRLLVKYAMTLLDTITRFYVKMDTKDKEPIFQEYNQPF